MKTFTPLTALFFIFCFFTIISCEKIELKRTKDGTALLHTDAATLASASLQLVSAPFIPIDNDSIERPTTLGVQLTNPYLIPNMQQAYKNLGYNQNLATVTNLYVRFKPTVDQLAALDSIMDSQGLELFDTPMDYDITYEGDYYQDPSIPDSLPTWQYAVVPTNFQFPSGIQYQTLASIHIPGDDYTAIESEAERLASIQDNLSFQNGHVSPNTQHVPDCGMGNHWDIDLKKCVPNNCSESEYWNGTECVPLYPPAAPDAAIPAGNILVHDTNLGSDVGARKARVVAKRWFKIERTYTDNNGHFVFTKRFKHKVKINVKFKNDFASVRGMRGVRLWQMLFPVKVTIGIFSGDKSNINRTFGLVQTFNGSKDVTKNNKSTRYWAAATTLNSVQEYREYATAEGTGLPPTGIKIILSNWGHGTGATPMFAKRASNDLPAEFVSWFMSPPVAIISSVIFTLKHQVDIVGSYNFGGFADFSSDVMKELFYHELTHSTHYAALGNSWYTTFVNAELFEIVSNISSGFAPYGNGSNSQSAIVALGEGWAYHIGHFFTDKKYGMNSSTWEDQGIGYFNNSPINGLSSHLNLLENFNPNSSVDHFKWIPTGLFYDLLDPSNERLINNNPVDDYVAGYTNQQMFNAFTANITTLGSYKTNLLNTTTNTTSQFVSGLFSQYHY